MKILRAEKAGCVARSIGNGEFHFTGEPATKALAPRPALKSTTAYTAALTNRLNDDFPVAILSADAATRFSLRQLRARARHLERNGGIHGAYLSLVEADTIGSKGICTQMKIRKGGAGWDNATDYLDAKPVKGRVIEDPQERAFLKSLDGKARLLLATPSGEKKRALLRDQEPEWKNATLLAARTIKAGDALFEEDAAGEMSPVGELDRFACFIVEREWKQFCKRGNCEVTGKHSMMDFNRLTLRTSARDGDAILLVYLGYANRWGISFQLIEGDYLDDYYNVQQLPNGNRVRMGVELDRFGKKVALWVFAHHPGDYGVEGVNNYDARRRRIPILGCPPDEYFSARDAGGRLLPESVQAIHITRSLRAEETRAVPWITPAMELIHHIETLKTAEITAARAEACKHKVYERDLFGSDGSELDWEKSPAGELNDEMQPAMGEVLPPGYKVKLIDPNHPNPHFPDFLKSMKREVSMAVNKCYAILFGDMAESNYSNLRGGLQNQRECDKMVQQWFVDDVFDVMHAIWLKMSLLSRALPFRFSEFERLNEKEHKCRRWPWVDPKNDAETAELLLKLRLTTKSKIIADMSSDDYEEMIDELDYEAGYEAGKANLAAAEERQSKLENPQPPAPPAKEDEPKPKPKKDEPVKALALKSAFLGDIPLSDLPADVQATVAQFHAGAAPVHHVTRYGMTVPELLDKADQHNLSTARHNLRNARVIESANEVHKRRDKFILLLNDRIVDGHHHLAKAEKGKVTSSLPVLDLTPLRFQSGV